MLSSDGRMGISDPSKYSSSERMASIHFHAKSPGKTELDEDETVNIF